jgi:hypothetical protein
MANHLYIHTHTVEHTVEAHHPERGLTMLQHYWMMPLYALVRFGHWDEILAGLNRLRPPRCTAKT